MAANASSGILDTCKCRISIRMEEKGGRNFRKLGFTDVNLAEYAGAGPSTQRYILQPYDLSHRLDNSIGRVKPIKSKVTYLIFIPYQKTLLILFFLSYNSSNYFKYHFERRRYYISEAVN